MLHLQFTVALPISREGPQARALRFSLYCSYSSKLRTDLSVPPPRGILLEVTVQRSVWSKVILALWLTALVLFWLYVQRRDETLLELFGGWLSFMRGGVTGPLVFFVVYLIRPFLLVPITLLTVASGFLFGAVWGSLYALVASLFSTALAYLFGHYLAGNRTGDIPGLSPYWTERLRTRAFESVLLSRFLFLPGDLVNYAAGALRISFTAFMLATLIGGIPGLLVGVLAGASLEGEFSTEGVQINVWYLLASALLLVSSLALSTFLRRRQIR